MIEVEVFNSSSNGNCYRLISGSSQLLIEAGIKLSDIRKKTEHQLGRLDVGFSRTWRSRQKCYAAD